MFNRRYLGIALTIAVVLTIGYYFSTIVSWLVIAWIISLLGSPLMNLLGRIRIGKFQLSSSVRAVMVILVFYLLMGLFFYIFVPVVIQQGRNLAGINYATIAQKLEKPIAQVEDWLISHGLMQGQLSQYSQRDSSLLQDTANIAPIIDTTTTQDSANIGTLPVIDFTLPTNERIFTSTTIHIDSILRAQGDTIARTNIQLNVRVQMDNPQPIADEFHDTTAIVRPHDSPLEKLQKQIVSMFNPAQIPQLFSAVIAFFGNFMVLLASVTFIAFFFLKDEKLFGHGIKAAVPDKYLPKVDAAIAQIRRLLSRYFTGILIQVTAITIYLSVFLGVFGVQNAILIAFFAAVINVIPYVGPIIGLIFGLFITITSNLDADFYATTIPLIVKVTIGFATMQTLDNFVLQPVIFSNSVMAHPLEIFIVIIVGAQLGGVSGMVIAVPMYTVLRVIAASFLNEFKIVQQLTETIKTPNDNPNNDNNDTPPPPAGDDYAK